MIKKIHLAIIFLIVTACKNKTAVISSDSFYPCDPIIFWEAVKWAESSNDPMTKYMESWGEASLGLYQVSMSDAKRYGCPFEKESDAFNELKNTVCKDLIVEKLRHNYTGNWSEVLGRYWSTLRREKEWPNSPRKPYNNFTSEALKLGCKL